MIKTQPKKGAKYFVGMDLGGTKIEIAAFDQQWNEALKKRIDTPNSYPELLEAVTELVSWAEKQLASRIDSIGIGMPGAPLVKTRLWRNCNLVYCNDQDVQQDLETALQRTVLIENDANCFALSEAYDGAAKDQRMVFALTIGTGVGGAIVVDRCLHQGFNKVAGEVGHIPLPWLQDVDQPLIQCHCGRSGCVEQYMSGTGFENDYHRLSGTRLKGKEIIRLKEQQEPFAVEAYMRLVDRFARFFTMMHSILDPDIIVLGGGMSNIDGFINDITERLNHYMFSSVDTLNIAKAFFGDSSGVRGAARLTVI